MAAIERDVTLSSESIELEGTLRVPSPAHGLVLFAHGSGSSRFSPRNRAVAAALSRAGFATCLLDLLTPTEERVDAYSGHLRFDIGLLAGRLVMATQWLAEREETSRLPVAYFGASTGAAAALVAAAHRPSVTAVVSRGGRPDLAGGTLTRVRAPTLLVVGGADEPVLELNRLALARMRPDVEVRLEIVPGATHLFEEPGALETVAKLAVAWFRRHTGTVQSAA